MTHIRRGCVALVASAIVLAAPGVAAAKPKPAHHRSHDHPPQAPAGLVVGGDARPLEVDGPPQFGWLPRDPDDNETQSAYEIRLSRSEPDGTARVWDSGRVRSSDQSYVPYTGPALDPGATYDWTVRTWDRSGRPSPWAKRASFDTGLRDQDWQAQWIRRVDGTGPLSVVDGRLRVSGGDVTLLEQGRDWTDYTLELTVRPRTGGAGWVFRAPDQRNGYMWQLGGKSGSTALRVHRLQDGKYTLLGSVPLGVEPGQDYHVKVELAGDRIRTFVDGTLVDDRRDSSSGRGTIGFREASGEVGEFDDVRVTAPDGGLLFADDFSHGVSAWDYAASGGGSFGPDDYTLARREVTVGDSPVVRARAYVAAYHQYALHVGGRVVDHGPAFNYPDQGYYHVTDVTSQLHAGRKTAIGVLYHWYGSGQGRPAAAPGMLLRLVIDHADGSRQVVVSDGSWRVTAGPWLAAPRRNGDSGEYVERIDGREAPVGWDAPGFDDSSWQRPQVVGTHPTEPFTHLQGQQTRLSFTTVHPVRVTTLPSGAVVADFGKVIPAVPVVRFSHGVAGRNVDLWAGYRLTDDGEVSRDRDTTQGTDESYGYVERDGAQTFHPFTYLGFRYLEIANPGESLDADAISAVVQHVAVDRSHAASFHSSDPGVDAAFALMQRSALYSAQQQFLDTPTREKGPFLGDGANESRATMLGWGERNETRKAIREFVESQQRYWPDGRLNAVYPNGDGKRDIPDYTEVFPSWVWRYYVNSGDRATLADAYPTLAAVADYVRRYRDPQTGLVTHLAGGSGQYRYGIVDWPATMRYGYDMGTAARTTVNILAVDALKRTADAAAALGRPADEVQALRKDAADLTADINAQLRRPDGIYVDGLEEDGSQSAHASQIANAYAVAFGVAPRGSWDDVTSYVAGLGMQMGPMTAHWLLAALADAGRTDQVVRRLTDASTPGWASILAQGGTFTWESWDALEVGNSLSHGWGSTALVGVLQSLLGVKVTAPGGATVAVRPPRTGLRSAQGSVWTQRGRVAVAWGPHGGHGLSLDVTVPDNVRAEVYVPAGDRRSVKAHGRGPDPYHEDAEFLRMEGGYAVFRVGSGETRFDSRSPQLPTPVDVTAKAGDLSVGKAGRVTTTFTNRGERGRALRDVRLSLEVPDGWTVEAASAASFAQVAPGETVTTTWDVTASEAGAARIRALAGYDDPSAGARESAASPFVDVQVADLVRVVKPEKLAALRTAEVGARYYVDRDYTLASLPDALADGVLVPGANEDKAADGPADYLELELTRPATVYVAFDARGEGMWWPSWLAEDGFQRTGETIRTSDTSTEFVLFARQFDAGQIVLGPNSASGNSSSYFTIVVE